MGWPSRLAKRKVVTEISSRTFTGMFITEMKITALPIEGAYVVEIDRYGDHRGYLQELYNDEKYPEEIRKAFPVKQNTLSTSHLVSENRTFSQVVSMFA